MVYVRLSSVNKPTYVTAVKLLGVDPRDKNRCTARTGRFITVKTEEQWTRYNEWYYTGI